MHDFDKYAWYLDVYYRTLHSQNGEHYEAYTKSEFTRGDIITCIYNASTSEISYEKNGVSLGVAFTNVKGEDIAPAVLPSFGPLTLTAISYAHS